MGLIRRWKLGEVKVVAHQGGRDQTLKRQTVSDAPPLPVHEEKRFVLSDRTAQGNAELILLQDGLRSVGGKVIAGVQFVVSKVFVHVPMKRVRARFDGHVYH